VSTFLCSFQFAQFIIPYLSRFLHGCYPQRILVDKIYRNREAISWCRAQGIQLTGPALGRPAKNAERTKQAKKQEYQDICDRNIVEGEFGVGKRSYGLNRIMARLQETSFCVIGIALLCMNLAKRLWSLLRQLLRVCFFRSQTCLHILKACGVNSNINERLDT